MKARNKMRLVKCNQCGKIFPEDTVCYSCGNESDLSTVKRLSPDENVQAVISEILLLLRDQKYKEAIDRSYTIFDEKLQIGEIFWLRLLAKKNCSTIIDLLKKGFSNDDPDYYNALKYCTCDEEHKAYSDIGALEERLKNRLKEKLDELKAKYTYQDRDKCNSYFEMIDNITEIIKQDLVSLYEIEQRLLIEDEQLKRQYASSRSMLQKALKETDTIKRNFKFKEDITRDLYYEFLIKLNGASKMSAEAKRSIAEIKESYKSQSKIADMIQIRDEIARKTDSDYSKLKELGEQIKRVNEGKIDMREKCRSILDLLNENELEAVEAFIGNEMFADAMEKAGVYRRNK